MVSNQGGEKARNALQDRDYWQTAQRLRELPHGRMVKKRRCAVEEEEFLEGNFPKARESVGQESEQK